MIRGTLGDFQAETKERKIEWIIQELPVVWADVDLLRLVLVNLVSNAVKFTGHRTEARIEIGCAPAEPSETVIFIRDNGAGFNPQYTANSASFNACTVRPSLRAPASDWPIFNALLVGTAAGYGRKGWWM